VFQSSGFTSFSIEGPDIGNVRSTLDGERTIDRWWFERRSLNAPLPIRCRRLLFEYAWSVAFFILFARHNKKATAARNELER